MRDLIITSVLLGVLPFAFFQPYIGILAWTMFGHLNPHRFAWGFAETIPFAALIGGTTLVGVIFSREEKRFPFTALTAAWMLFALWISFTTLYAIYPDLAVPKWILTIKIMLMSFVTLMVMAQRERINLLVWVIVLSLGFYGFKGGIFTLIHETGGGTLVRGPDHSFIGDNNSLALALIMVLPLMYYLQKTTSGKFVRFGLFVLMVISTMAIVGTHSRGGFLGLAAVGIAVIFQSHYKIRGLIAVAVSGLLVFALSPAAWIERLSTIQRYEQDSSAMARFNSWGTAYNLANDKLLGGGFDTMHYEVFARYAPGEIYPLNAHSVYFEVLAEHGFIGLALFLLIGFLALRTAGRIMRETRDNEDKKWAHDLAAMTRLGLIGYYVSGAFLNLAYFDLYYQLLGILVLIRAVIERESVQVKGQDGHVTTSPLSFGAVERRRGA